MKKILALVLVLCMVFALAACGQKADSGKADAGMKVALVTDVGNIDDKSFNQGAWEGVV